jgi:hypothetical protein
MNPLIKNQKLGLIAIGILVAGFLGLLIPIAFHWNLWILAFVFVRRYILVPLALSVVGLWLDRPKYAALIGLFLAAALYVAPRFIIIAQAIPDDSRPAWSIICFVDQSGAPVESITLNFGDKTDTLRKSEYWSQIASFALLPITDTPNFELSAEVGFTDGPSIQKQPLQTKRNSKHLRHLIVFIRPERTLETIPFY